MTIGEAILLGIIQGIFMFFPVSSTSHLALTQHFLISRGSALPAPDSAEMIFFDLVVHVGTLVSMAVVFRTSLTHFVRHLAGGVRARFGEGTGAMQRLFLKLAGYGALSVVVTGLIGLPLKVAFETIFATPIAMSVTLTITGILLWWTDRLARRPRGLKKIDAKVAVAIGAGQGLALMPGLSRSGTTIVFALLAGLKRPWAAEYSFFIAFPTTSRSTCGRWRRSWRGRRGGGFCERRRRFAAGSWPAGSCTARWPRVRGPEQRASAPSAREPAHPVLRPTCALCRLPMPAPPARAPAR